MAYKLTLSRKALILLVGVPLICQLAFFGAVAALLSQAESARTRDTHARNMIQHANSVLRLALELGSANALGEFLTSPKDRAGIDSLERQIEAEGEALGDLSENHPEEENYVRAVREAVVATVKKIHPGIVESNPGQHMMALRISQSTADLFNTADRLMAHENLLRQNETDSVESCQHTLIVLLIAGIGFNFTVAILAAALFTRSTISRLNVLMSNIGRVALRQPLPPIVEGEDEIAELDRFFHQMASTLDDATSKERAAVQNAIDVICSIDADGRILAINPACEKNWGYSPDHLLGRRLIQIVQAEDAEQFRSMIEQSVSSQNNVILETRIKSKDGAIADTQWSMNWSQEEKSLFCMATDISERKRLDAQRKEFVSLVRDGLKTPLVSIYECLKRMADSHSLNEAGRRGLIMAEDNSGRLIDLVNDLLDIERMESGKLQLSMAPCAVARIIERSIRSVSGLSQVRRVQVETPEIGTIQFEGDEDRLVQVLVNLLSNAIKFSNKDSHVSVTASEGDDWLEFSVKDFGRGVPAEMREAIFERFKQVEAADERVRGGRGLGLAICKTIVEEHKGTIGVRDNFDAGKPCGSDFWFRLPRTTVGAGCTRP